VLAPVPSVVFCQFPFVILGEVVVSSLGVLLFAEHQLIGGFPYFIHFVSRNGLGGILFSSCIVTRGVLAPISTMACFPLWGLLPSSPEKWVHR
jgi:hypothetical protein